MKTRVRIFIRGIVQGVGFRPFIFRLANEMKLNGMVQNTLSGVIVEAEGDKPHLDTFMQRIAMEKPPLSAIHGMETSYYDLAGYEDFRVVESSGCGDAEALILPDIGICEECAAEMFDPSNRRYLYPFINCTNCGPRFSIITSLPYDRFNTSMNKFQMCDKCRKEYEDPSSRRFHAQPIACPDCGPTLLLLNPEGRTEADKSSAVENAAELIKQGKIIALKGLGGFQLIADACNDEVIMQLRERKNREAKPFAVMCRDFPTTFEICDITPREKRILCSPESPIVLMKKRPGNIISEHTAPGNPYLGIMLPYTPLHRLLIKNLTKPVIATSGNLAEEPMCITEEEAFGKLKGIADYFLIHNRPIIHPVDDSVVRIAGGRIMIIRRARGYAPLPIGILSENEKNCIAYGAHVKSSISLKKGANVFISQHIGDLDNTETEDYLKRTVEDLSLMYNTRARYVVHDMHPDYSSTRLASETGLPSLAVQHHEAHAAACYSENQLEGKCLAVCWDGTGYGYDGAIWGSEFFKYDGTDFRRLAHLRYFEIPGSGKAVKDIKRSAAGIFYSMFGEHALRKIQRVPSCREDSGFDVHFAILDKRINCYRTSSMGRLIDAVSWMLGVSEYSNYEGESAMKLEFAAEENTKDYYPFDIQNEDRYIINWGKVVEKILADIHEKIPASVISSRFHNTLINFISTIAMMAGEEKIVLSGGCFQNMYLLNGVIKKLKELKFHPYWHQRIPTNDGGISFGQAVIAASYTESRLMEKIGKV